MGKRDLIVDWRGIFWIEPLLISEQNSQNKPQISSPLLTYNAPKTKKEREKRVVQEISTTTQSRKGKGKGKAKGLLKKKKRQKIFKNNRKWRGLLYCGV